MKNSILTLAASFLCLTASAQFVATVEVKEDIPGLCNKKEVYALFPFDGQVEATCSLDDKGIKEKMNAELQFLKDKPKYKDEGMIGLYINCNGEVVKCEMDNKTKSPELDKQIEALFNSLTGWKAGTLNGKAVDSMLLFSFEIKKGQVVID